MYSVTFEPRFPGLRFAAEAEEAEVVGCQTSLGECSAEKCCYDNNYGVIRTSVRVVKFYVVVGTSFVISTRYKTTVTCTETTRQFSLRTCKAQVLLRI